MNELWKDELKKDINRNKEESEFLKLDGYQAFVLDLASKEKKIIEYEDKKYTYHIYNLIKNESKKIKFTNYQYIKLIEELRKVFNDKEPCRYIEVTCETKNKEDYKKEYFFKIKEMGDNLL